jgi:hypothetical protein
LQSVNAEAVEKLSEGETLSVGLRTNEQPQVIEVRNAQGDFVGALIDHITDLLRCIQDGYEYVADVKSVDGGHVRVEVHAR